MNTLIWRPIESKAVGCATVTRRLLVAVLGGILLQGCLVGPDYVPPQPEMPDAWHQALTKGLTEGEAGLLTWWTTFNDPVLSGLIRRAVEGNLDLKQAVARIREARARRGIATGGLFPDLDGFSAYSRDRVSEHGLIPLPPGRNPPRTDFYASGFDASWEIDLFGGIHRSIEAADASLEASVEDYRDVLVTLYAEIALSYVEVRTFQARISYAEANVIAQRETLKLTEVRRKGDIAPELDVQQAKSNLANSESEIPTLRIGLVRSLSRLGVLVGKHPTALHEELSKPGSIPTPPKEVTVGIPANLLRQRPDIRRAERVLAAQTARVGVATADLYPRLTLFGLFDLDSTSTGNLFTSASRTYGFGPAFSWNIFDGGRVLNNIRAEEAITEQALIGYEKTVLRGLEDVENAMVAFAEEQVRRDALHRAVTSTQESVKLVQLRYKAGIGDFQNVLDAERSLFRAQDRLAASEGAIITDLIALYKALGGGWSPQTDASNKESEAQSD